jgi:hypothetical protein
MTSISNWLRTVFSFTHGPTPVFWGYGAELSDPDGYPVRIWDEATMPGYSEK